MNKHQKNPEKIYRTQPVRRGYTKNTTEYWQTKPGQSHINVPELTYPELPTMTTISGIPALGIPGLNMPPYPG